MFEQILIKVRFDQIYIESLNLVWVYSVVLEGIQRVSRDGFGSSPFGETKGTTIFILVVKINISISINGLDSLN
jgi:hypothetical protein